MTLFRTAFTFFIMALAATAGEKPNIILVMADDLGYGDPQCYQADSKIPTPHIDRMAAEGMRFTDAHSPSAVCTPTRYGLLTGRYAWRTVLKRGVLNGESPALISPDRQTVAGMLQEHGYHTGIVGKWHLGLGEGLDADTDYAEVIPQGPLSVGFENSYIIPASLDMPPYLWLKNDRAVEAPTVRDPGSKRVWDGGQGFWRAGLRAPSFTFEGVLPAIARECRDFIDERAKKTNEPFFLYVPLASPHTPWVPSQEFKEKTSIGAYGDFVHQTDWALGEILKALDEHDLAKDTVVIFTSDNGSHWPERMIEETGHKANLDWRGQKADIHEGGHRVPYIVRWPAQVAAASVSDQLICLTDFMATAAALVEHPLDHDEGEDSYNHLPVLLGKTAKPVRKAIVHHSVNGTFAIRVDQWKLILGQGSGGFTKVPVSDTDPEGQLYNLEQDPGETVNLYAEKPEIVSKLKQTLERYQKDGRSRLPDETADLLERLREDQFKRIHQELFRTILEDKPGVALNAMDRLPGNLADDGETYYMRAVAYTALGKLDDAVASSLQAAERGVPVSRFIGGSKHGLAPLQSHPVFQELRRRVSKIVHGPMLGQITGNSVHVWVRTLDESTVRVAASAYPEDFSDAILSRPETTTRETDFTAEIALRGLEPNTTYHYRVLTGDQDDPGERTLATHTFRTLAQVRQPARFRLAFGGGAGYVPENERAFDTIRQANPNVLILLGDNVYSDAPKSPAMQHYCYYRRQARPEFSRLVAETPVFSIWDDHDFGLNDCVPGPEIEVPAWKRAVYGVFRNNWVNPAYGGGDAQPGCYYDFYLGDVHFIMLDGRYYRNLDPEKGEVSMLGPVQREWFLKTLGESKGTFKVICSPVPWVFEAKGDSKDTWNGFREERGIIFDFLAEHKIEGVLLMSADRHRSDLWRIDRENGYSLYEFNSSRLTNQHVHGTMEQALFSYNKKQSFGLVDFDTMAQDPTVSYSVVSIDGETVNTFRLQRSQLEDGE